MPKTIEADTFRELLKERIRSGDWWILLPFGGEVAPIIREIVTTYYADVEAPGCDSDYALLITPLPIAMFHKRRMGAMELAAIVRKYGIMASIGDIVEHIDRGKPVPIVAHAIDGLLVTAAYDAFMG